MALKGLLKSLKSDSYIIKPLDTYLVSLGSDKDRAPNVNSPSQAGKCMRANYYARKGYLTDGPIDARTQRIFDNGTFTHIRLQEYLLKQGILICDEVPCINKKYNIQGHTDGFLNLGVKTKESIIVPVKKGKVKLKKKVNILSYTEIGILEIKSINSYSFTQLKDAKEEHKKQAMIYLYCAETRRKKLHKKYNDYVTFKQSEPVRKTYYENRYSYLEDGHKYTREEKINFQVNLCLAMDEILFNTKKPITKVIFLYENKDNQELKEFCVKVDQDILDEVLSGYAKLNKCCEKDKIPKREGTSKSCETCRWCNYKIECWC